jgi:diguanylate cyclase (GGDEF)-like protein
MMPGDRRRHPTLRSALVLLTMFALAAAATVTIARMQDSATSARDSQLKLTSLRLDVAQIQQVPWGAAPGEGDSPASVHDELQGDQQQIQQALDELSRNGGLPERARVEAPFKRTMGALWEIFRVVSKGRSDQANKASDLAARQGYAVDIALQKAAERNRARSLDELRESKTGLALAILLLFLAFALFYVLAMRARRRAETLAADNRRLLAASRAEALTDALTGLGNRRALLADLEAAPAAADGEQTVLALFDLDGFKQYNDSFGHPAGDAVLNRLGGRLAGVMVGYGRAYRMGGDEFCVLASVPDGAADEVAALAASSLVEKGVGFSIVCSFGLAQIPADTTDCHEALRIADTRMYEHKRSARTDEGAEYLVRAIDG